MPYRDTHRLPVLDGLRIATPCDASWQGMPGDDLVRTCHRCDKEVYNLSAMTRKEAELLIAEREGSLCARLWTRPDGTVITSDCDVGRREVRSRRRKAWAAAGAMTAAACRAVPLRG